MKTLHTDRSNRLVERTISQRRLQLLLIASALLLAAAADAQPFNEFRALGSIKKFSGAALYSTTFGSSWLRVLGSNHLETNVGVISRAEDHRPFVSVGPVWRLHGGRHPFYLDLGISPTLMAGSQLGHREMGGSFFFSLSVSTGYRFDNGWAIAARLQHISNSGLHSTNPGLDLLGLSVVRSFDVR